MKGTHRQISLLSALARRQIINSEQIQTIVSACQRSNSNVISHLINEVKLDADQLALNLAESFGIPLLDVMSVNLADLPESVVSEKLIRKHNALPVFVRGKVLFIAVSDPTNMDALEEIEFNTGFQVELVICSDARLQQAIDKFFESLEDSLEISSLDEQELSGIVVDNEEEKTEDDGGDGDDAPIVVYINKILLDSIRRGASDLHFEPYEQKYRIRFRIDGVLHEVGSPPVTLSMRMAARLKVMSKLDIAEKTRATRWAYQVKAIEIEVYRFPSQYPTNVMGREDRYAYSRLLECDDGYRCSGLRARTETALHGRVGKAARHDLGHRTDGFW